MFSQTHLQRHKEVVTDEVQKDQTGFNQKQNLLVIFTLHLFCRERVIEACSSKPQRSSDPAAASESRYASPEWAVHGTVKEKPEFQ